LILSKVDFGGRIRAYLERHAGTRKFRPVRQEPAHKLSDLHGFQFFLRSRE
jgi:hypothetical protein